MLSPNADESDAGLQVKGWFPRGCIHPLSIQFSESEQPYDSQVSDTQISTHSDSQYSPLSESDQDSPDGDGKIKRKLPRDSDTDHSSSPGKRRRKRSPDVIKKPRRSPVPSPRRPPQPRPVLMPSSIMKKDDGSGDIKRRSPIMTRRRKK